MLGREHSREATIAILLAGLFVAGLAFLYLWQSMALSRLRAEEARLVLSIQELREEKILLEHKLQEARSPKILSQRARALGMGPFDLSRIHYLTVEDGEGG